MKLEFLWLFIVSTLFFASGSYAAASPEVAVQKNWGDLLEEQGAVDSPEEWITTYPEDVQAEVGGHVENGDADRLPNSARPDAN